MDTRIKRAFWPFVVVLTGALWVVGVVIDLRDAQELFGWPLSDWLAGVAVLAISALGWKLFDLQGQLDELRELASRERPQTDAEDVAEIPSDEGWADSIAILYREAEWAEEYLLPVELATRAKWVHFRSQEKRWRWKRVLPAMENAECSREYIARVRDMEEWEPPPGTPKATIAKHRVKRRIALIREAAAESERKLARIRNEPFTLPMP